MRGRQARTSERDGGSQASPDRNVPRDPREQRGLTRDAVGDPSARTERAERGCRAAGAARGAGRRVRGPSPARGRRSARDCSLEGSWHLRAPPPPAVAAGLGRAGAAAGAGPAGCLPGLACQRGGGWQLDRRGRARRGRTGAAWQLASGSAEAQPDVRGLGSGNEEGTCRGRGAGAGRSGTVLGSGGGRRGVEIAQVGRAAPAETLLWEAHCFLLT